ncbi:MAG: dihydropteroate synthase [Candidatus Electryoneaceae bacterium]|nr:dihydropteroate synthase [Candidatus Electryoneaceae bacterium]
MNGSKERIFRVRNKTLHLNGRTLVMGIVNVTPDSFSDGGEAYEFDSAVGRAEQMIADGADIIDIGGESTRPGSETVSLGEEIRRVIPVIETLAKRTTAIISIDTYKAEVAKRALIAGAHIVNDISAGTFDDAMPDVVAQYDAGVVLMHIKGTPRDMQKNPVYGDLIGEIKGYLTAAVKRFTSAGVNSDRILVDPGIGFGKTLDHNLELIRRLDQFRGLGAGILLGVSRKSFIGLLTDRPVKERLAGTIAAVVAGVFAGADVVRVHDVVETVDALKVVDAITRVGR